MRWRSIIAALLLVACPCLAQVPSYHTGDALKRLEQGPQPVPHLQPRAGKQSFHLTGDTRTIYDAIGRAFGISMKYDQQLPFRSVKFNIGEADFAMAMRAAAVATRTYYQPVSSTEALIAANTPDRHRELDRYATRMFYLPDAISLQELNEIAVVLGAALDIRYVTQNPANRSIEVRAPAAALDVAEQLLSSLDMRRPQVALDFEVYEIDRSMLRNIGVDLPLQFQVFNIGAAALAILNAPNAQNLIQQLLAGGLNAGNLGALAGLIGQLQNQQGSLFANPIATFGGGATLFGISVPPATINFSRNESQVRTVERGVLRAGNGEAATMHIGLRYPIATQQFSSGVNIPGLNLPVGQITGVAPGIEYQDLGITFKATPFVNGANEVRLALEMTVKSLGAQQFNGVPVIQNRLYTANITVPNGERAVVAGMMTHNEMATMRGVPGVSHFPLIAYAFSTNSKQDDQSEILVIITPRVMSNRASRGVLLAAPTVAAP